MKRPGALSTECLTRSLPQGIFTDSHPGGRHFWQCCFRFWRKGWVFHCQTNSKCNSTWSKSNVIQTYWWCQSYGFRAVWKRKRPAPSRALLLFPLRRRARRNFYRPSAHRLNTRSNDGEGEDFFLPSRVFQVYDCYFTNVLTQRSCFEAFLTADSQCFTRDDARIFVPTIPRRRWAFTVSWNTEVFVHCEQCGQFLLTRRPRHQFPLPANLHRHSRRPRFQQDETSSLLDRRRLESIQTYSSYQLVSHLGTSTTMFPAIWTKTAWSIEELFSQWTKPKTASSGQRTDEEDTSETCNNNQVGGRALTNA